MADEQKPRAVSGEIMTDRTDGGTVRAAAADIIEADYISLPSAPRAVVDAADAPKPPEPSLGIGTAAAPSVGMDMLRRHNAAAQMRPARGGPLFWTAGIGIALAAFWVSGGHALIGFAPFGAATPSTLTISGVTSRIDASGPRPILLVDGEAENGGAILDHLPALEIAVTGNDGRVTRYRLGTSGRPMASGETFAFSSRLDVPKNGVKTVSVAFAE